MAKPKPKSVDIITYDVGFGDCFLLRFNYEEGQRPRTVLIDFGSTHSRDWSLAEIAKEIKHDCGGKLDVVVATHRHKDHVHGFSVTKAGKGTGKVIRDLEPSVVIMPWTEDPDAQPDAEQPTKEYGSHGPAFAARLSSMQALAGAIELQSNVHKFWEERGLRKELAALGENNLGNAAAMKNLREMGRRTYYAYHEMSLSLSKVLPGVKVHVLGPPTLKQTKSIEEQRQRDEDEFWHLQAHVASSAIDTPDIFSKAREVKNPVIGRWLRRGLRKSRAEQLLAIVRSLDGAMNNTSLILLFEVGDKKLLFPGDAQYENWMYALSKPWVKKLLRGVDVYKVGHHGSLNATPKTMFELFEKKRSNQPESVMHSLLSTLDGVHGSEERRTEVPRKKLVNKLRQETELHSTADFGDEPSRTVTLEI